MQVEPILESLFEFFKKPEKMDFEEELVDILVDLIPQVQTKVPYFMTFFDNIEKLADKVDFEIELFFDVFEQMLNYGLN